MGDDMERSDRSAPASYGTKDSDSSSPGVLRTVKSACDVVVSYMFPASDTDGTNSSRESDNTVPSHDSLNALHLPRRVDSSRSSAGVSEDTEMNAEERRRLVSALGVLLRGPYRPMYTGDPSRHMSVGVTRIPHCRQLETWDCGIACIQMVLRWLRDDTSWQLPATLDDKWGSEVEMSMDEVTERKWVIDAVETESVWTVDLVIILERLFSKDQREMFDFPTCQTRSWDNASASYLFCSTKLSVDKSYNEFGYYRNAFSNDEARVTKRFALANELNLPMLCLSKLEMSHVLDVVSRANCVAIVLVDNRILARSRKPQDNETRKRPRLSDKADTETAATPIAESSINAKTRTETKTEKQPDHGDDRAYAGHYVLLCGLSVSDDDVAKAQRQDDDPGTSNGFCLVIKNPGSLNSTDFVTPAHFERAWRASGTDDDIIFIAKHNSR